MKRSNLFDPSDGLFNCRKFLKGYSVWNENSFAIQRHHFDMCLAISPSVGNKFSTVCAAYQYSNLESSALEYPGDDGTDGAREGAADR